MENVAERDKVEFPLSYVVEALPKNNVYVGVHTQIDTHTCIDVMQVNLKLSQAQQSHVWGGGRGLRKGCIIIMMWMRLCCRLVVVVVAVVVAAAAVACTLSLAVAQIV